MILLKELRMFWSSDPTTRAAEDDRLKPQSDLQAREGAVDAGPEEPLRNVFREIDHSGLIVCFFPSELTSVMEVLDPRAMS